MSTKKAKPNIREYVRANYTKQGPQEMADTLVKAGHSRKLVMNIICELRRRGLPIPHMISAKSNPEPQRAGIISVEDFRRKNDIYLLVSEAAKNLKRGELLEEATFIREFIAGKQGYRPALDHADMKKYRGKQSGGKYLWGHPEDIAMLRKDGLLN